MIFQGEVSVWKDIKRVLGVRMRLGCLCLNQFVNTKQTLHFLCVYVYVYYVIIQ
jgi:hypothetical protein